MLPERTAQSYGPAITGASKTVLLELMTALRSYRDALVLVGGWAPYFLLEEPLKTSPHVHHVGSIDIDLAVDPAKVNEPAYATIVELLTERGYRPAEHRRGSAIPHSLDRMVSSPMTRKPYTIRVDFLTRPDEAPSRWHLPVQDDLFARKVKGCEAAFQHQLTYQLTGVLPNGGELTVPIQMANLVAMLTMKGIVLGERYREKDAYDIYMLVKYAGGGPAEVAQMIRPHLADPLVQESMQQIQRAFHKREANGPAWVASFLVNPQFATEHQRLLTDAFMVVSEFTTLLARSS